MIGYSSLFSESVSPGTMVLWGGGAGQYNLSATSAQVAVEGWLYCDGKTALRSAYPALFAQIGTRYNIGGEAGTDFRLPGYQAAQDGGTMWKYTNASTNAEYTDRTINYSHSHTLTSNIVPTINTLSNSSHVHSVSPGSPNTGGGGHSHNLNATISSSSVPSSNAARTGSGGTGSVTVGSSSHTHGVSLSSTALNAESHTHTSPSASINTSDSHNHTAPTISISTNAGLGSIGSPVIRFWYIIKI